MRRDCVNLQEISFRSNSRGIFLSTRREKQTTQTGVGTLLSGDYF